METVIIEQEKVIPFKKLKNAYKEYIEESGNNISFSKFFIKVLNYSNKDFKNFIKSKAEYQEKKKHKLPKNIEPKLGKTQGLKDHPEYNKYYNIVCEFRKYIIENQEKINLSSFLKEKYNLSDEESLNEAKKVNLIIYSNTKKYDGSN